MSILSPSSRILHIIEYSIYRQWQQMLKTSQVTIVIVACVQCQWQYMWYHYKSPTGKSCLKSHQQWSFNTNTKVYSFHLPRLSYLLAAIVPSVFHFLCTHGLTYIPLLPYIALSQYIPGTVTGCLVPLDTATFTQRIHPGHGLSTVPGCRLTSDFPKYVKHLVTLGRERF